MPNYNYNCGECGESFTAFQKMEDRATHECKCGATATQGVSRPPHTREHEVFLGWFEHIAPDPIYITSKSHLRDECEKHGCYAPGVLD